MNGSHFGLLSPFSHLVVCVIVEDLAGLERDPTG